MYSSQTTQEAVAPRFVRFETKVRFKTTQRFETTLRFETTDMFLFAAFFPIVLSIVIDYVPILSRIDRGRFPSSLE